MAIAKRWIERGYSATLVLNFVGVQPSTYYYNISKSETQERNPGPGRPISEYSYTKCGLKVSDEQIKEYLMEHVTGDGYAYGYKKLTSLLQEKNSLKINHKKVYRLCKELNILRTNAKLK
ncbi:MAG: IS3 family transposase [Desulfitobacteriaceae bacterium]|nr:IS3 family transposase [Desulfitobacteriaceae bacterium]